MLTKWVLITGASQGIGVEFARLFARDGWNLVLVARDEARLAEVARELESAHAVKTKILKWDLAKPGAAAGIFETMQKENIEIAALVNNAGFGLQGAFAETELARETGMIDLNITALVELTHLFVKPMVRRGEGRILNVASTAAFQPGPFMAVYYASKAFVYSFSCALAEELKGTGVTVTTVCPGITTSEFHTRAGLKRQAPLITMSAAAVARIGYHGLLAGKPIVVTGALNRFSSAVAKALPTRLTTKIAARVNRPQ